MKQKVLVGLLCNNLNPANYYNVDQHLAIDIIKFRPDGIDWSEKKIRGIILENGRWKWAVTCFPDAVYNRCYTSSMATTKGLEKVIGQGKVFNGFTQFNKYTVFSILKPSKLGHLMIPTHLYNTKTLLNMLSEGPVLIKPAWGTMGHDVYRFTLEDNEYKVYSETLSPMITFKTADELVSYIDNEIKPKNYIIQPFITFASAAGHVFDMRQLVQKNQYGVWDVTAGLSRLCFTNCFVTNTAYDVRPINKVLDNTEFKPSITDEMRQISIQVAELLENNLCPLGEISVDFGITSNGRLWIIEINGRPQKHLFNRIDNGIFKQAVIVPLRYAAHLGGNYPSFQRATYRISTRAHYSLKPKLLGKQLRN